MKNVNVGAKFVGQPLRLLDISDSLASIQNFVGGYFEMVRVSDDGLFVVCNEDGRRLLKPNARVQGRMPDLSARKPSFIINLTGHDLPAPGEMGFFDFYGDFFFTRVDDEGELIGISKEDFKLLST